MAPTRTVKNKHAANRSGIKGSKASKMNHSDGVVKSKKPQGKSTGVQIGSGRSKMMELLKKKRKGRVYSEKELDIPKLNTITPVGVQKPKGKKKGKIFVDDRVRFFLGAQLRVYYIPVHTSDSLRRKA